MYRTILAALLVLATLSCRSHSQNLTNPPSTVQEERLVLMMAGDPNHGPALVKGIGLDANDTAFFLSQAQSFYATQQAAIVLSNQEALDYYNLVPGSNPPNQASFMASRDANVNSTWGTIYNTMDSPADQAALNTYLNNLLPWLEVDPGSDIISSGQKDAFAPGQTSIGSTDVFVEGWDGVTYTDGYSGAGPFCPVFVDNYDTITDGTWHAGPTAPSGTTVLNVSTNGTMLAASPSGLFLYDEISASFLPLGTGQGTEIVGDVKTGIYAKGTDSKLYAYNAANNTWPLVSGAGYPFTTISHVAADGSDYSLWATSGSTVAAYIPGNSWVTIGTAPSAPVSISTNFVYDSNVGNSNQAWYAYFIGANGLIYDAYYYESNGAKGITQVTYTGYTGTPQKIRVTEDRVLTIHTSDGKNWQTSPGGTMFTQVTGQSGNVMAADGIHGIYVIASGVVQQFVTSKTLDAKEIGSGNFYINNWSYSPINSFEHPTPHVPAPRSTEQKVSTSCNHGQVLKDTTWAFRFEHARTYIQLGSTIGTDFVCGVNGDLSCIYYNVNAQCDSTHTAPDFFEDPSDDYDFGLVTHKYPWGAFEDGLCASFTGHQPFTCTGGITETTATQQSKYACTHNP